MEAQIDLNLPSTACDPVTMIHNPKRKKNCMHVHDRSELSQNQIQLSNNFHIRLRTSWPNDNHDIYSNLEKVNPLIPFLMDKCSHQSSKHFVNVGFTYFVQPKVSKVGNHDNKRGVWFLFSALCHGKKAKDDLY